MTFCRVAQTATFLIHGSHEHRAEISRYRRRRAGRCAGDLHVADKATVESLRRGPAYAVVGGGDLKGPAAHVEVVKRDVHAAVCRAEGVVVHPHRLAIVARVVMSAGPRSPGDAIGRGPQANALAAATGYQVAGEPLVQLGIEHHDRIAIVCAMPALERWRQRFRPGRAAIGGIGRTGIVVSVMVVVVGDHGMVPRFGAGKYKALALGAAAARAAAAVADQNIGRLRIVAFYGVARAAARGSGYYSALHQG